MTYYSHDATGRLMVRHHVEDGAAYFAYDPNGNRTIMQDPTGTT